MFFNLGVVFQIVNSVLALLLKLLEMTLSKFCIAFGQIISTDLHLTVSEGYLNTAKYVFSPSTYCIKFVLKNTAIRKEVRMGVL